MTSRSTSWPMAHRPSRSSQPNSHTGRRRASTTPAPGLGRPSLLSRRLRGQGLFPVLERPPMTGVTYASTRGRWVVLATVLGSGLATIDATVVGIALPAIGREFHTGLTSLQWIVTGYTLTLAGLLLVAGAMGDRYGRRRVFVVGVVWFALASLLCGLAPNAGVLIAARTLQGVGAALLTPSSLAILEATFVPEDRGRAIGAWSGLGGLAAAVGPFLGGWLISAFSWRVVFYINLPLAAVVILVSLRHVPETRSAVA